MDARNQRLLAIGTVAVVAVVLAFFLMRPDTGPDPEPEERLQLRAQATAPQEPAPAGALVEALEEAIEEAEEEEEAYEPGVTKTCKWIRTDHERGVPMQALLRNMRDRGARFTEQDLACLTATTNLPPAILDYAESRPQRMAQP